MDSTLAHIAGAVKHGGQVAISGFQENLFHPLAELLFDRFARYRVQQQPHTWKRIATEAGCKELFSQARLTDVRVEQRNVGYFLARAKIFREEIEMRCRAE
jgi:hypothetical protein